MAKLNSGYNKRWSLDRHDVSIEVLEDMGVSLLNDDSNSSDSPTKMETISHQQVTEALKRKECSPAPASLVVLDHPQENEDEDEDEEIPVDSFLLPKRKRIEGPPGLDSFTRLSDEIILCIFKWLPKSTIAKCAQVSKRWKRLAYDEVLWRRLDLSGTCLKPSILGTVLLRGTQVLRLAKTEVCDPIYPLNAPLPQLCPSIHNLLYLDLSMATISVQGLYELFQTCSSLKKLSLEHCTLDDRVCKQIGRNGQLDSLNMSMCYGISSDGLAAIMTGCPKLENWNLAWTNLNQTSLQLVCTSAPPLLQRINLSGCRGTLLDEHVKALCRRCPNLVELDVSDCSLLTQTSVAIIHENLHRLEYLAMSRCSNVQVSAFLMFHRSELLYLDVFGLLTDATLQTLRSKLPHIEINKFFFSSVARPTVGIRRTSIWGLKVRE